MTTQTKKFGLNSDGVRGCFLAESEPRPATPAEQKPFRKSFRDQPGKRFIHRGLLTEGAEESEVRFGMVSDRSDSNSAAGLLQQGPQSTLAQWLKDHHESGYASHKAKPLGKSGLSQGYGLPSHVTVPEYSFGIKTSYSESAKTVVFPENTKSEGESEKSARDIEKEVTKPKDRHYDWSRTGIDPTTHTFGAFKPKEALFFQDSEVAATDTQGKGVERTLKAAADSTQTHVVPKIVNDVRSAKNAPVGARPQPRSSGVAHLSADHTFGVSADRPDEWGAGRCILGDYPLEAQVPDKDLGRSRRGLQSEKYLPAKKVDSVFGVTSIRKDKAAPLIRSVADTTNYGDEKGAKDLLFVHGLRKDDFAAVRPAKEVRKVSELAGMKLTDEEFKTIASAAIKAEGHLSVATFRKHYNIIKLGFEFAVDN